MLFEQRNTPGVCAMSPMFTVCQPDLSSSRRGRPSCALPSHGSRLAASEVARKRRREMAVWGKERIGKDGCREFLSLSPLLHYHPKVAAQRW